jgi:hypothetical protein
VRFTHEECQSLYDWATKSDLLRCRYCGSECSILDGPAQLLWAAEDDKLRTFSVVVLDCSGCGHVAFFFRPSSGESSERGERAHLRLPRSIGAKE